MNDAQYAGVNRFVRTLARLCCASILALTACGGADDEGGTPDPAIVGQVRAAALR
jgi:hypothetical protein